MRRRKRLNLACPLDEPHAACGTHVEICVSYPHRVPTVVRIPRRHGSTLLVRSTRVAVLSNTEKWPFMVRCLSPHEAGSPGRATLPPHSHVSARAHTGESTGRLTPRDQHSPS